MVRGVTHELVDRNGGQKNWLLSGPCRVPPFADDIVGTIVKEQLLGDGEQVWYAPAIVMDHALAEFQQRHAIVVPLMLQQKDVAVDVDLRRAKREIRSQFAELVRAQAELEHERPVSKHRDDEDEHEDDDEDEHEDEHEDDDEDGGSRRADEADGPAPNAAGSAGDAGNADDAGSLGKRTIPSVKLGQNVVRRLVTTLMHDVYMRRLVDELDLCSATFLNLHGLVEARNTYSCLEAIFIDYDDDNKSHWRSAVEMWRSFLGEKGKINALAGSLSDIVDRAIKVHDVITRHAKFHCHHYPAICPHGQCKVDLTHRPLVSLHTCFVNNKELIMKARRVADDE